MLLLIVEIPFSAEALQRDQTPFETQGYNPLSLVFRGCI